MKLEIIFVQDMYERRTKYFYYYSNASDVYFHAIFILDFLMIYTSNFSKNGNKIALE